MRISLSIVDMTLNAQHHAQIKWKPVMKNFMILWYAPSDTPMLQRKQSRITIAPSVCTALRICG